MNHLREPTIICLHCSHPHDGWARNKRPYVVAHDLLIRVSLALVSICSEDVGRTNRWNGRASSSLTARGGGLPRS